MAGKKKRPPSPNWRLWGWLVSIGHAVWTILGSIWRLFFVGLLAAEGLLPPLVKIAQLVHDIFALALERLLGQQASSPVLCKPALLKLEVALDPPELARPDAHALIDILRFELDAEG